MDSPYPFESMACIYNVYRVEKDNKVQYMTPVCDYPLLRYDGYYRHSLYRNRNQILCIACCKTIQTKTNKQNNNNKTAKL